jgi:mono/diheme cytochrome c family protein
VRTLTLALALAASISLVGCQPSEEQGAETTPPATESPAAETPAGETPAATEGAAPGGQQVAGAPAGVDLAAGEQIFATNCATCHGPKGAGDGPAASALNPRPTNMAAGPYKHVGDFDTWKGVIANGVPGTGMAPWSGTLSEDQINNVTAYALSLKK